MEREHDHVEGDGRRAFFLEIDLTHHLADPG
jgi:hypothetical protein